MPRLYYACIYIENPGFFIEKHLIQHAWRRATFPLVLNLFRFVSGEDFINLL